MLGTLISQRYQIISLLGRGGFGETYLAEDRYLPGHPKCVVKQLKPQGNDPEMLQTARRLFNTEAEVLYRLGSHPQIPQLLAHFEENQEFSLVQELIEGPGLREELRSGQISSNSEDKRQPFSEKYVIDLLQGILQVLEFVHAQGVIHRDIKPANLIRRESDQKIVLIDFGAVKEIHSHTSVKKGDTYTIAIGSEGYMPNEQLAGMPRFSSDIYAVGMIGIEALTGVHPRHLTPDLKTNEIIWRDYREVSNGLAYILDKMVRYDFRQREQSVADVIANLQNLKSYETAMLTVTSQPRKKSQTITSLPEDATKTSSSTGKTKSQVATLKQQAQSRIIGAKATKKLGKIPLNDSHKKSKTKGFIMPSFLTFFENHSVLLEIVKTHSWQTSLIFLMLAFGGMQIDSYFRLQTLMSETSRQNSKTKDFPNNSPVNPSASEPVNISVSPSAPTDVTSISTPVSVPVSATLNQQNVTPSPSSSPPVVTPVSTTEKTAGTSSNDVNAFSGANRVTSSSQALGVITSLNNAQQLYYLEHNKFSQNLSNLGLNFSEMKGDYHYQIVSADGRSTIAIATPKKPGLKGYASAVFLDGKSASTKICETNQPTNDSPGNPQLSGNTWQCPSGSSPVSGMF